ncbi:hypothetical protein RUND412_000384 [Rhizina undulata]
MSAKNHPSFKERIRASPFIGKSVEVGDFFWGDGVTLHSNGTMKQHLGFENNKNKNRKRRCFYILQIISESLVTTTTRNSNGWNDMPEEYFKYFLPIDQTPEVRGRRAIPVCNDWEGAFKPGKSLLYLEDIEVIHSKFLCAYICSAVPREIRRIQWEARTFDSLIWWGNHLSPTMIPGSRERTLGQFSWNENRNFMRLSLDSKGLIILPESKRSRIRHSCKSRVERHSYEPKPAKVDTPIASDPVAKNLEATSPHTTTPEQSISNGLPRTMISKRPSPINVLAPGTQINPSHPPPSPHSDSGYESSLAVQKSGIHSMSRQVSRRIDSPWRRGKSNSAASSSSSEDGFQEVQRRRKFWYRV